MEMSAGDAAQRRDLATRCFGQEEKGHSCALSFQLCRVAHFCFLVSRKDLQADLLVSLVIAASAKRFGITHLLWRNVLLDVVRHPCLALIALDLKSWSLQ